MKRYVLIQAALCCAALAQTGGDAGTALNYIAANDLIAHRAVSLVVGTNTITPHVGTGNGLGVVTQTRTAGQVATVLLYGQATCEYDGAMTAGNITTIVGDKCHDSGVTAISLIPTNQGVFGRIITIRSDICALCADTIVLAPAAAGLQIQTSQISGLAVTSVATSAPLSGGPVTGTGTIACPTCTTNAAALTSNAVVIGGGGQAESTIPVSTNTAHALFATAGAPGFRAVAAGDIPTLNQSTTGNAQTATALAANPADCSAGQYATTIAANGDLTCAQVAYAQVSGTPTVVNTFNGRSGAVVPVTADYTAAQVTNAVDGSTARTANTVFSGPVSGGPGAPTFRALVAADLPPGGSGTVTNVATTGPITGGPITTTGTISCATCATTTNGGALTAAAPVAISAAGQISLAGAAGQIPNGAAGAFTATPTLANAAAPASPGAGNNTLYSDSTDLRFHDKNANGIVATTSVPVTCTNQVMRVLSAGGVFTCATVTSAMTSGEFPASAHNILSANHGDTTVAGIVRGDGFFAVGATPTWQRVARSAATGGYFKWNGTDIVASTLGAAGTGACTNQVVTGLAGDVAPTCAAVTNLMVDSTISGFSSTSTAAVTMASAADFQLTQFSLPAGYLNTAGRAMSITAYGTKTTVAAQVPVWTVRVKLCTVSGCGSGTVLTLLSYTTAASTASTTTAWSVDGVIGTIVTGASGTVLAHGLGNVVVGATGNVTSVMRNDANTAPSAAINLTAALFLQITIAASTGTTNTAVCHSARLTP